MGNLGCCLVDLLLVSPVEIEVLNDVVHEGGGVVLTAEVGVFFP
jgi:hypothetical protein